MAQHPETTTPKLYSKPLGFFRNHRVREEINALDPMRDHCRMVHLMACYEFPWDMARSLELALMRTFTSPRIATLLYRTGEFTRFGQKRYDDTSLLVAEFMQNGYDSPQGKQAIEQMNRIHSYYPIPNEDYLYVLTTFIFDPIDWMEEFGWRKMTQGEKVAYCEFFRQVAIRMGLSDIPATLEDMRQFARDYEREHCRYTETNHELARATMRVVEHWFLQPLRPFIRPFVTALFDERMLRFLGYKKQPGWLRTLTRLGLKARALALNVINPHSAPALISNQTFRTYPNGHEISDLAPEKMKKNWANRS